MAIVRQVDALTKPIDFWRNQIFERTFGILALICVPVYLTSVYLCVVGGLWQMAVFDTIAYSILLLAVLNKRLSYTIRFVLGCGLSYVIGIAFLIAIGPSGAGFFWLYMFPPLTALLLSTKASTWAQCINVLSLSFVGIAYHFQVMPWPEITDYSSFVYGVVAINFIATNALLTLMVAFIVDKQTEKLEEDAINIKALSVGMCRLAEYQSDYAVVHALRVEQYVQALCIELMKLEDKPQDINVLYLHQLAVASILHDIGNIEVDQAAIYNSVKMNADEFEDIKLHAHAGQDIIRRLQLLASDSELLKLTKQVCGFHHENWDGSGYPHGAEGQSIPLAARIVRLCDAYDGMTSTRSYKSRMTHQEAVDIIIRGSGKEFDPMLVECFTHVASTFEKICRGVQPKLDKTQAKAKHITMMELKVE